MTYTANLTGGLSLHISKQNIDSLFLHQLVSVAVVLESLAAQRVAVVRPVPGNWMAKRPDREASLML